MPVYDLSKILFGRRRLQKPLSVLAIALLIAFGFDKITVTEKQLTGYARVIDGDTIALQGAHIRLYGIDAPESKQTCRREGTAYPCGKEATDALTKAIDGQPVTCDKVDMDPYGRIVAICKAGPTELNREMVATGHALAYRQYTSRYVPDEAKAEKAKQGLWAGSFKKPWDYRHGLSHRHGS